MGGRVLCAYTLTIRGGIKTMPFLNGTKEQNKFLFDFTVLCGKYFINEHIALANENIKKAIKENTNLKIKLQKIEQILLEEF